MRWHARLAPTRPIVACAGAFALSAPCGSSVHRIREVCFGWDWKRWHRASAVVNNRGRLLQRSSAWAPAAGGRQGASKGSAGRFRVRPGAGAKRLRLGTSTSDQRDSGSCTPGRTAALPSSSNAITNACAPSRHPRRDANAVKPIRRDATSSRPSDLAMSVLILR
jgi:hypothetical protein